MIKVDKLNPFGRMCITLGMIPSSYKESLTYEEQLLWFMSYLQNTVIPALNNNADAIIELQSLYEELKSYVDNYFENLDVQEEINNKLDDMAESGELTEIISEYLTLGAVLSYNTVADLKAAENLADGSTCRTLGYFSLNDNGGALYKIRTLSVGDVIDEARLISLYDDTLVAELIMSNEMNVRCFGVTGNGTTDVTTKLQNALNLLQNKKLILNNETYIIGSALNLSNNEVIGNKSIVKCSNSFSSNYMLNMSNSNKLKGIVFDNNNMSYSTNNQSATDLKLVIENCEFIHTKINTNDNNFALNNAINLTAKESIIKDSKIYDNLSHGLRLISSQSHSTALVENCKIYNNGNYNGTVITACGLAEYERTIGNNYDKVIVSKCEAYNNANSGFAIHSLNNCLVTECYSHDNLEHGITLMDGQNATITNCILENNSAYGVRVQGDYNSLNPGYTEFIITNNIFLNNSGIHISNNIDHGLITNNLFKANVSGTTKFGVVIGDADSLNDTIKYITIKDNKYEGTSYSESSIIYPYYCLDESNDLDLPYAIIGNIYNVYITPRLKYSNVYDNLNTSYSDLTSWTISGTLSDNTITPSGGLIARKNFAISGAPKFINIMMNIETYLPKIGIGLRFRDSQNNLITLTRKSDGLTSNIITAKTKYNSKLMSKVFDLTKWTFGATPAYYEVFLESDSNTDPITINGIYTSCSNDNTVINSI